MESASFPSWGGLLQKILRKSFDTDVQCTEERLVEIGSLFVLMLWRREYFYPPSPPSLRLIKKIMEHNSFSTKWKFAVSFGCVTKNAMLARVEENSHFKQCRRPQIILVPNKPAELEYLHCSSFLRKTLNAAQSDVGWRPMTRWNTINRFTKDGLWSIRSDSARVSTFSERRKKKKVCLFKARRHIAVITTHKITFTINAGVEESKLMQPLLPETKEDADRRSSFESRTSQQEREDQDDDNEIQVELPCPLFSQKPWIVYLPYPE